MKKLPAELQGIKPLFPHLVDYPTSAELGQISRGMDQWEKNLRRAEDRMAAREERGRRPITLK